MTAHFGDYNPADFGWAARDPERDSSLLVPFVHSGVGFGSMHRDVVGLFTALLDELVPLIPGGLVAGQCGCFNPNSVTVGGSRSFHTYGIAIDVNWGSNPMYAQTHPSGLYALPAATSAIARKYGCEWGGDWTYPQDWMHIECHLSPDEARTETALGGSVTELQEDDMTPEQAAQLAKVATFVDNIGVTGQGAGAKLINTIAKKVDALYYRKPDATGSVDVDALAAALKDELGAAVAAELAKRLAA